MKNKEQALEWWNNLDEEDSIMILKIEGIYGHDEGVSESEVIDFYEIYKHSFTSKS